jgi:hypothetical protein
MVIGGTARPTLCDVATLALPACSGKPAHMGTKQQ